MATAAKELVPAKRRRKPDGRANNGGVRAGAGRAEWQPEPQMREFARGTYRKETVDEAWARTRQEVRHLVATGVPFKVMGSFLNPALSEHTLRKHFDFELKHGKLMQNVKMAGVVYAQGMSGRHPDQARFWLRTQAGWSEKVDIQVNGPIQFQKIEGDDW